MKDRNKKLKSRVEKVKEGFKSLGFDSQKKDFAMKYPEFISHKNKEEEVSKKERLNNLWYCRVFDEDFTKKLEAFLTFKKTQYK